MKVFVDTKTIRNCINDIDDINRNGIKDSINKLDSAIDSLKHHWSGSDADYFQKTIFPFIKDLEELQRSLDDFCDYAFDYIYCVESLYKKYKNEVLTMK